MDNVRMPDHDGLRAELLACHQSSIDAHWKKDVGYFTRDIEDGYLSVSDGEIRTRSIGEIESQFKVYLQNTTFSEYKDLREPIIRISKDGSMAWLIAQTKIAGMRKMEDGSALPIDFTCAYIMLYERQGDTWIRIGDISTYQ